MKEYSNNKSRAISSIEIGDSVLIRQKKHNKLSTKFDSAPFYVQDEGNNDHSCAEREICDVKYEHIATSLLVVDLCNTWEQERVLIKRISGHL